MNTKKLGFGLMRLPLHNTNMPAEIDMEQLNQMVDTFLERGFSYFDTAYMYHMGKSEIAFREAVVKRHRRDLFTIATKLPTMFLKNKEDQERIFNEQLKKCGVDYFDYYLLHNLGVEHYRIAQKFESFAFILEKKKNGKIRQIGFSYHDNAELLDEILTAHPEVDFVQLQINYIDWDNDSIQSRKCYHVARKHNIPIMIMEPVKGGTLANIPEKAKELFKAFDASLSIPSWAIRFGASLEGVSVVLSGMSTMEQLDDNTSYMQDFHPFNQQEYDILNNVIDIIKEAIVVPCTACQYCVEGCPKKIAIPKYFALYNAEMQAKKSLFSIQKVYYDNYTKSYGKASECIHCKKCERQCPQHIEITKYLNEVVATFEPPL